MILNKILKNNIYRNNFKKNELKILTLKTLSIFSNKLNKKYNIFFNYLLFKIPNLKNNTSCRNICLITGRSRGVFRIFKLSRFKLRDLDFYKNLIGFKKSSW